MPGRDDPAFRKVAHLARELTAAGYFIASGGGPGIMEAANLGAYLAGINEVELDAILDDLSTSPNYTDEGYLAAANRVIERYPTGTQVLRFRLGFTVMSRLICLQTTSRSIFQIAFGKTDSSRSRDMESSSLLAELEQHRKFSKMPVKTTMLAIKR